MKDIEGDSTAERIDTDLNTLMNNSPTNMEKKIIKTMRNIATLSVAYQNCKSLHDL